MQRLLCTGYFPDIVMNTHLDSALRLYAHIQKRHWNGEAIMGPDPVGKIQWRLTRFLHSYAPWWPDRDTWNYLQAQAYWLRSLDLLHTLTHEEAYRDTAEACADGIIRRQLDTGGWYHPPIRFRKGLVSTVEGTWGALGLLSAHHLLGHQRYLESAKKWFDFLCGVAGLQKDGDTLAARYYAGAEGVVPNVTTMTIWLAEALYQATDDSRFREPIPGMVRGVSHWQLPSGELPYELERTHFMCFQYNAFEFEDLAHYYELSGDERMRPVLEKLAGFLMGGLTPAGACRYNCFKTRPEVNYWTSALAVALRHAHDLNLCDSSKASEHAFKHVLERQRPDGAWNFSEGSYGLLTDRRSYPRYLAMMLYHLLWRSQRR